MKRIFFFIAIAIALTGCQDNDNFTASKGALLTFPSDTLMMDTVFAKTPSSTYSFWVYNNTSDGIRLQNVRLERRNQTGFRVNVDGIYLDNSNGSQVNDLELRGRDSLLVFVELTAQETRQADPQPITDNLVFALENGTEQKVVLQAWAWDADKVGDLLVAADTTIESSKPLVVMGGIHVAQGATLTLRNTTLYFHDQAGMDVDGKLLAENCVMRGDRLDRMFPYLPYDRVSGQWGGIRFGETSTGNELVATEIRNAMTGVTLDSAALDSTQYRLMMRACVVHNCQGEGLLSQNARILLDHCQLTNAAGNCLSIIGGMADIRYCTIAQFYAFSQHGAALRFSNLTYTSDYDVPLLGLTCEGSIITGYADDEMAGVAGGEEVPFRYQFANCLMRTPKVETGDSVSFTQIIWESPKDSIGGQKHFVRIDSDNLIYDFHLDSLSTAKGLGCY